MIFSFVFFLDILEKKFFKQDSVHLIKLGIFFWSGVSQNISKYQQHFASVKYHKLKINLFYGKINFLCDFSVVSSIKTQSKGQITIKNIKKVTFLFFCIAKCHILK